ncbi:acyltransferase family protein [Pseudarthrobacter quantipunctorum]|uniref:Acyltransferase n=1 Tax=Pseudarthrobacter quantipunctorum TaxID=3128980 RepID=A0ABZ2R698_9MICC
MSTTRLASLDGLRGVAAVVVLVHHSLLLIPQLSLVNAFRPANESPLVWLLTYTPLRIFWAGSEAVLVFFVLSGMVLALPALRVGKSFDWRAYYPARIVRLYLPVVAAIMLAFVFAWLVPRRSGPDVSYWLGSHAEPLSVAAAAKDALLLIGRSNLVTPLWSLKYEVIFSLFLPVYVFVLWRFRRHWVAATVLVFVAMFAGTAVGNGSVKYLPIFAIGVLLAVKFKELRGLAERIDGSRRPVMVWRLVAVLSVVALCSTWYGAALGVPVDWLDAFLPLVLAGATGLIFVVAFSSRAQRFFSLPTVTWLGTISFSLYLVHEPIIVTLGLLLSPAAPWLAVTLSWPISLIVAWGFYVTVERRSHKLAKVVGRVAAERLRPAESAQV